MMNEAKNRIRNGVADGGNNQQDPPLAAPPENQNRPNVQRTMRYFVSPYMQGIRILL